MLFNVVLSFFNLRYKVSITWDSKARPSDFRSNALPTELADLTQGWSVRPHFVKQHAVGHGKSVLLKNKEVKVFRL